MCSKYCIMAILYETTDKWIRRTLELLLWPIIENINHHLLNWYLHITEQLDHIEEGLDTINNEMKQAERALKRMSKCCGICFMPWQRWAYLLCQVKCQSRRHLGHFWKKLFAACCFFLDVVNMDLMNWDSIEDVSRAGQPVDEDGMWKLEDGTADSSKNHKNWNSGAAKSGRFITK